MARRARRRPHPAGRRAAGPRGAARRPTPTSPAGALPLPARRPARPPDASSPTDGPELWWTGDFVVRADGGLPRLLRAFERPGSANGHTDRPRSADDRPGRSSTTSPARTPTGPRLYWHEPATPRDLLRVADGPLHPRARARPLRSELADPLGDGRPAAREGHVRRRRAATWARRSNSLLARRLRHPRRRGHPQRRRSELRRSRPAREIEDSILLDGCRDRAAARTFAAPSSDPASSSPTAKTSATTSRCVRTRMRLPSWASRCCRRPDEPGARGRRATDPAVRSSLTRS